MVGATPLHRLYKSNGGTGGAHHNGGIALTGDHEPGLDLRWMDNGNCSNTNLSDVFYPKRGAATSPAEAVCSGCPVRYDCLVYGMGEKFGIWGGFSERARRRLKRTYAKLKAKKKYKDTSDSELWRKAVADHWDCDPNKLEWFPSTKAPVECSQNDC